MAMGAEDIHVAVAVVFDAQGRVLITQRATYRHQGGKWEFPGGKLESGESAADALLRELLEEVGIVAQRYRYLLSIRYAYPEKTVVLQVFRVDAFHGEARSRENQPLRWVHPAELDIDLFPAANVPIIHALRLPDYCLMTPDISLSETPALLTRLQAAIRRGVGLIQLRNTVLDAAEWQQVAKDVARFCRQQQIPLLLNADPAMLMSIEAAGIHLNRQRLYGYQERPLPRDKWLSAACHSHLDILQAKRVGVDFVFISPVKPTASHPGEAGMGWPVFKDLCQLSGLPVYALGGMRYDDLAEAQACGARGVAGIRGLISEHL